MRGSVHTHRLCVHTCRPVLKGKKKKKKRQTAIEVCFEEGQVFCCNKVCLLIRIHFFFLYPLVPGSMNHNAPSHVPTALDYFSPPFSLRSHTKAKDLVLLSKVKLGCVARGEKPVGSGCREEVFGGEKRHVVTLDAVMAQDQTTHCPIPYAFGHPPLIIR